MRISDAIAILALCFGLAVLWHAGRADGKDDSFAARQTDRVKMRAAGARI